jgi:anti-sigma-K factor RskA
MATEQNQEIFDILCAGYVLGSLDQEDINRFEEMLKNANQKQLQLYEDMKAISAEMALLYPEQIPSTDIRSKLINMAWASVNSPEGTNVLYLSRFRFAVAASVVFMIVALGLLFQTQNLKQDMESQAQLLTEQGEYLTEQSDTISELSDQVVDSYNQMLLKDQILAQTREQLMDQESGIDTYRNQVQELQSELSSANNLLAIRDEQIRSQSETITDFESRLASLQNEVQRKEELLTILEARDVDLVLMDGLDVNPEGYGKVVWDKDNGRAILQVANLPVVPTDRDYQLWFIINDQPQSAGVFAVQDPERDDFFTIEELTQDGQGAFAITMEPKGGSPQPTGDMYLLGAQN